MAKIRKRWVISNKQTVSLPYKIVDRQSKNDTVYVHIAEEQVAEAITTFLNGAYPLKLVCTCENYRANRPHELTCALNINQAIKRAEQKVAN